MCSKMIRPIPKPLKTGSNVSRHCQCKHLINVQIQTNEQFCRPEALIEWYTESTFNPFMIDSRRLGPLFVDAISQQLRTHNSLAALVRFNWMVRLENTEGLIL